MAKKKVRLTSLGVKNSQISGVLLFAGIGFPSLNLTGEDYKYKTKASKTSPPKDVVIKGVTQQQLRGIFDKHGSMGGQLEEVETKRDNKDE